MKRAPALALFLLCGFPGCPGSYQVPLPPEAELHRVKTSDGWELSLVHYRPKDAPSGPPVLLCHGISANARNMDVDADHSLARWLAAHGRDTWNLSWRATGDSDGVDASHGRPGDFPWEALWQQDYPAAIAEVRRLTGAPAVDFIGHSMGGMVLYAYLAEGGEGVRAAITLGSPTRLDWGSAFARVRDDEGRLEFEEAPLSGAIDFELGPWLDSGKLSWIRPFDSGATLLQGRDGFPG